MDTIKERLVEYLKISGISKKDFSEKTGISLWNLTGKSMQSEIGGSQISRSLVFLPNLNPDWLLLGKGEMLRQNTPVAAAESPSVVAYLEKNIADLRNELAQAYQTIGQLQQQLADHKEKAASQSATTIEATI